VWLFSVGMPGALGRPLQAFAMTEGPQVIAGFRNSIHPRDHRLFSGVVRPDQLAFLGRMIFRLMGGHYGDFRDWKEIDA
jgi:menaquinone-dependent protoporphyrinogen oxidase